jgi:hypothetical protein
MSRRCCLFALPLLWLSSAAWAVTAGQVSNFQDGTIQNWLTGPVAPLPTNIATGGPAGAGDRYLRVDPGAHLAFFNPSDFAGNYSAAGVLDVGIDILNFNPNTVSNIADMRVVLFGPSGSRWSSNSFVAVPPDNVWHHCTFSLRQSDLTQVIVGDTYASTMASVQQLMFRHDSNPTPTSGGSPFLGSIGADNITAIAAPEPSSVSAGIIASAVILKRRRRHA